MYVKYCHHADYQPAYKNCSSVMWKDFSEVSSRFMYFLKDDCTFFDALSPDDLR
jgi:hypothetical protein